MNEILTTVYHDSTKNFVSNPFPRIGDTIEVLLRVKKNDFIKKVFIRYRDQGVEKIEEMSVKYEKNGLTYYKYDMEVYDKLMTYNFVLAGKDKFYYYSQYRISDYQPDRSTDFKILVDYRAPSWMKDQVFYQILPDRFHNGRPDLTYKEDSFTYRGNNPIQMNWNDEPLEYEDVHCLDFYGGDLWGIIDKLDYLEELGVTGLYLNPIFKSPTMHKYDSLDYFKIDDSLGGEEALIALSENLHKRGMKLVLDISINHTSSDSKWFNMDGTFYPKSVGAYNNPSSEERDFYFINDDGTYESWYGVKTMPSLNYSSQNLRDLVYRNEDSVLKKYLKEPFNIDGWRFDVADVMARNRQKDLYYEVWEEINHELKSVKEDVLIMAEEWADTPDMYNQDRWDSTMNYFGVGSPLREFTGQKDLLLRRKPYFSDFAYEFTGHQLAERIIQFLDKHPTEIGYQMFNLINSHDVERLYNHKDIDYDVYRGTIISLFGLPGAVNIYYGDEKYLDGRIETMEGARCPMDWTPENYLVGRKKDSYRLYKTLANLKKNNEALKSGGFKLLHVDDEVFAFARFTQDDLFIFAWTKSEDKEKFDVDLGQFGLKSSFDQIIGNASLNIEEEKLTIELNPKESIVVQVR